MRIKAQLFAAAFLGVLSLIGSQALAQSDPVLEYYKEPGQYPTRSYLGQHFNERIDPHTGRLQHHYVDLFIPGNGGLDLKIQRSYTNVDEVGNLELGAVGVGWTMHFGRVLRAGNISLCDVNWAVGAKMPVLELPDGSRQILFRDDFRVPNTFITVNRWRAECMTSPFGLRVFSPDGTRYEMTRQSTAIPSGQQIWQATRIVDRNNNVMTIGYQVFDGVDVPVSISTSDGRSVSLSYVSGGANGPHLTSISDGTRIWNYGYTFSASVGWLLTTVTPPVGGPWQYAYRTSGTLNSGVRSMSRVTYPQGGFIDYGYTLKTFASGSISIQNIVVAQKSTSDGGNWTFLYTPSTGFNVPDITTVGAPNGTTTYKHVGYGTVGVGSYWTVGLLKEKQIGSEQTETYTWTSQLISNQTNQRPGSAFQNDANTQAPVLQQKVITRNGNAHGTTYSNFDNYGNAQSISESSSGFARTVSLTYQINTAPTAPSVSLWNIRQVKDETISVSGFSGFSITRTINENNGNVSAENRFGVPTAYGYDSQGNLASRTNARGFPTTFSNYKRGIAQTEKRPQTPDITRVVSNAGNVTSETDGAGHTVGYGYDNLNRLTSISYQVGNSVTIGYPTFTTMTVTRGSLTQTATYDGFGRMVAVAKTDSISPSQNSTVTLVNNALSQRTFVSYPNTAAGTSMTYDILDRVKTITNPGSAPQTRTYGATSIAIQNERGITHTFAYRAYGDPDKRELMGISIPSPDQTASVAMSRNPIGRITSVVQGGISRTYDYNGPGNPAPGNFLTSISEPETGMTVFTRDANGNMASRSVNGQTPAGFSYDALDRLSVSNFPGLPSIVRGYWGDGLLKSVDFGTTSRYFEYDQNKNLKLDRLTVDSRIYSATHTYAGNDGRNSTTLFPSGGFFSYSPNGFGRPTSALPFVSSSGVDFHPSGELKTLSYANGITTSISLGSRLWPEVITTGRPGLAVASHTYGYDGVGNVTSLMDGLDAANSMPTVTYDNVDRLASANTTNEVRTFSYGGAGNILTQTIGAQGMTYNYNPSTNLLSSISNASKPYSFTYDVYGNVANNGSATFQYDHASNMLCSKCGLTDQSQFAYDGLSMRVRMQKGPATTYFFHGLDGQLLLEDTPVTANGGAETKEYAYVHGKQVGFRTVSRVVTSTNPSASSVTGSLGSTVTLSVNVSGNSPTGTVTFMEGTTNLGSVPLVNGAANFSISSLTVGQHTITAYFSGDSNNAPSSTTIQVAIYDVGWLPAILQILLDD